DLCHACTVSASDTDTYTLLAVRVVLAPLLRAGCGSANVVIYVLWHGVREGECQGIAIVRRSQTALFHRLFAFQQDLVFDRESVLVTRQVGYQFFVFFQATNG